MKKFILILIFFFAIFISPTFAQNKPVEVLFFWSQTCPHCHQEKAFLKSLQEKYPYVTIKDYEISDPQNALFFEKTSKKLNADTSGVPFTVIGDQYIVGFSSDQTTGKQIEQLILGKNPSDSTIRLPIFGQIDPKKLSLPLFTFVIALLDGFNPCAMWTLVFLISLLLGLKDRKRMWILGVTFIAASALVYFLFLSAWLNLFLFIGFIRWVRIVIGLIALSSGLYYLYDFQTNKDASCKVTGTKKRQKIFQKLKTITQKQQLFIALGGIILLAFAVNLVELVCSAGLPAIYTQILAQNQLPSWQYYGYLLFYILIFMLDDLFVFFIAMTTLKATGIQSKYSRYSHLIGGILMFIIGILMIFKPQLLTF